MPRDRGFKNLFKFCVLNWISKINGPTEGAAGFDNFVWEREEHFNNSIRLRRKTVSTGSGKEDKFVEVLQNNFFKGLCIKASFGPAYLQRPVPDSLLNFPASETLALVASHSLKLEFDTLADIHPEIWRFGPE